MLVDLQAASQFYIQQHRPTLTPAVLLALGSSGGRSWLEAGPEALEFAALAAEFVRDSANCQGNWHSTPVCTPIHHAHLGAPIPDPGKIICVGLNYPAPGKIEPKPKYPTLFIKPSSSLVGTNQSVVYPSSSQSVFVEGELALVIGKSGKNILQEQVHLHIAGYTIANDIGAADLESRTSQWTSGKLADTFLPMGPDLVLNEGRDALEEIREIQVWVNEILTLKGTSSLMHFSSAELIAYISTLCTLQAGDIILTGSPKGISTLPYPSENPSKAYVQPGDLVRVHISGLGVLENPIISENARQEVSTHG